MPVDQFTNEVHQGGNNDRTTSKDPIYLCEFLPCRHVFQGKQALIRHFFLSRSAQAIGEEKSVLLFQVSRAPLADAQALLGMPQIQNRSLDFAQAYSGSQDWQWFVHSSWIRNKTKRSTEAIKAALCSTYLWRSGYIVPCRHPLAVR